MATRMNDNMNCIYLQSFKFYRPSLAKLGSYLYFYGFLPSFICLLVLLLQITSTPVVNAATPSKETNTLYEIKIPAPEEAATEQSKLLQQAFKEVLVQVSGSEKILQHPAVLKATNNVDNYVSLFGYQLAADQKRLFRVRFDDILINQLVESTGQPILDAKRPNIVVWLTTKDENNVQWVSTDIQNEISLELESMAKKRGLALVLPLLDLTDTAVLTEQKVWNEDFQAIETASKRYNAEQILIGRLTKQPSGWSAQWTYVKEGEPQRWELSNAEVTRLLTDALDGIVVRMAAHSTPKASHGILSENPQTLEESSQGKQLRLVVSGISDADHYAKVMKYLKGLTQVESVEVAEISPLQTTFNLKTKTNRENLAKAIAVDQVLVAENAELSSDSATNPTTNPSISDNPSISSDSSESLNDPQNETQHSHPKPLFHEEELSQALPESLHEKSPKDKVEKTSSQVSRSSGAVMEPLSEPVEEVDTLRYNVK